MASIDLLRELTFGARVAEEETSELAAYFVETDQWKRIVRGEIDVVRGEKGAGKSAIYSLLVARSDAFFDESILLVSAEKPRGTPVFKGLIGDPPPTESAFVSLWKLYLAALIADRLREFGIAGAAAKKLVSVLEDEGLLEKEFDITRVFRDVVGYVKKWIYPDKVHFEFSGDLSTGFPKIEFEIEPAKNQLRPKASGSIAIDDLFALANKALTEAGTTVWVLLDRLDVAFADSHELERSALRALFRVYLDLTEYTRIRLKIFIRSDIWRRISEQGFREASHITKDINLEWSTVTLLNLIIRRLLINKKFVESYGVNREEILTDFEKQKNLFYVAFPAKVEQATRKPSTLDWIVTRCADGKDQTAPREVIHLLTALRDEEIRRIERGELAAPEGQLFDRVVFKAALPTVSETRLNQTIYAEYPDLKRYVEGLRGEKTEQTILTLATLWNSAELDASKVADRLVDIGFFQKRGDRSAFTFWVPFLYRDALSMVQGLAEQN